MIGKLVVALAVSIAAVGAVVDVADDTAVLAFSIDQIREGKLELRSELGARWDHVSYTGGAFLVTVDGVRTFHVDDEAESPGFVLELKGRKSIRVICMAVECTIADGESTDYTIDRSSTLEMRLSKRLTFSAVLKEAG